MARIVLDTNVIISALLFDGQPERTVLRILAGTDTSVTSPFIIEETSRILRTKFGVTPDTLRLLQELLETSEIQYFQPFLNVVADEADNRIVETAVQGQAAYIVTGDKLLLALEQYAGISVVKPADFLQLS